MTVGLYKLIGRSKNREISSKAIEDFLAKNPDLDLKTRERLLRWENEFEFWQKFNAFISSKYGYPYLERALYVNLKKLLGILLTLRKVKSGSIPGVENFQCQN